MSHLASLTLSDAETDSSVEALRDLRHSIEHAAHLLPSQGPITVFVHHNTLHPFEHERFDAAVLRGRRTYGCRPYLSEDRYHQAVRSGRIDADDLLCVLREDLGAGADTSVAGLDSRLNVRRAMLEHPVPAGTHAELHWIIEETDALDRFHPESSPEARQALIEGTRRWVLRDLANGEGKQLPGREALRLVAASKSAADPRPQDDWDAEAWERFTLRMLWEVCWTRMTREPGPDSADVPLVRHRDFLRAAGLGDLDQLVHPVLIRFTSSFLDQGFAHWMLPDRDAGFLKAFVQVYRGGTGLEPWLQGLRAELRRIDEAQLTGLEIVRESLEDLGVGEEERDEYLVQTLLSLRGWAGMVWQMETSADWTVHPAPQGTLVDFLAVQLLLERLAVRHELQSRFGSSVSPARCRQQLPSRPSQSDPSSPMAEAFRLFQLAQLRGWTPGDLFRLPPEQWRELRRELHEFDDLERRRLLHLAYERHYHRQALQAVATQTARMQPRSAATSFQVVCCIDDREESFRRHLEEIDPDCETLSAAGFFAVAMYYRGAGDAHFRPLCPNIIQPRHYVQEEVVQSLSESSRIRKEARKALGTASHRWHLGSRTFLGGFLTGVLGTAASIPIVMRILFPRATAQVRRLFGSIIRTPPQTDLRLYRQTDPPEPQEGHFGYTLPEMTDIVERILRDLGLTSGFSRLVLFLGHGSSSLNNPHESAYNCGACSGGRGGPNARSFCRMANDSRVRERLRERGLVIPEETAFLGGFHNTCNDAVELFDLDRLPFSHTSDLQHARAIIDQARQRNAHERCRRFESAPVTLTPVEALRHVEARSEDLAQARPEYNHATNALCIVGRRSRTRGLFLDRRAFLNSYDASQDDAQSTILARILSAAIPVCAGISLEYYFSTVDELGYGCGSKLPHNIASLLGVMEGAASDLRTGLSSQMVEIHEPMRILFIIECAPEAMLSIVDRNETIAKLVKNEWVRLAVLDPHSDQIQEYVRGRFVPFQGDATALPTAASSRAWYRGQRDNLGFASIHAEPVRPQSERETAT